MITPILIIFLVYAVLLTWFMDAVRKAPYFPSRHEASEEATHDEPGGTSSPEFRDLRKGMLRQSRPAILRSYAKKSPRF